MAHALSNTNTNSGFIQSLTAAWQAARAKRAVYNRTYNELNALHDRDLADIGISRSEIRALAAKAAKTA